MRAIAVLPHDRQRVRAHLGVYERHVEYQAVEWQVKGKRRLMMDEREVGNVAIGVRPSADATYCRGRKISEFM